MAVIVAALDGTDISDRVLQTAVAVGDVLHVKVRAFHVGPHAPQDSSRRAASRYLLPLERVEGEPAEALAHRLDSPDVVLGVLGTGPTAVSVASAAHRPVVVVPQSGDHDHGRVDRVLVLSQAGLDRFGVLTDTAEMFRRAGVPVEVRETADAVHQLGAQGLDGQADLVVMGWQPDSFGGPGPQDPEGLLDALAQEHQVPVLLVPLTSFGPG